MDQDHIVWKSWKPSARTSSPIPSLFVAQRPSTYSQGNTGKVFVEIRGGVACWSTKAAISLKHVDIEEQLLWRAYRNSQRSFERCHPRLFMASSSPRLGFATPSKTPIAIISGADEAANFKFGWNSHRVHPNKIPLKILVKRECGRI